MIKPGIARTVCYLVVNKYDDFTDVVLNEQGDEAYPRYIPRQPLATVMYFRCSRHVCNSGCFHNHRQPRSTAIITWPQEI